MPVADLFSQNRQPDEEVDQIGSRSSTPPGATTPRPDFIDKRLPGIAHCIGQVGAPNRGSQVFVHGRSASSLSNNLSADSSQNKMIATPVQPHMSVEPALKNTIDVCSSLLASAQISHVQIKDSRSDCNDNHLSPAVAESASDESRAHEERSSSGSSDSNTSVDTSTSSDYSCRPDEKMSSSSTGGDSRPNFLSRIVSLCSQPWLVKHELTESLHKNTPPQTPRTRSQEDETPSGAATPKSSKTSADPLAATIGPVLGKLTVQIREGRGLRPSVDPYVVVEFQLSQYISEGPVKGGDDSRSTGHGSGGPSAAQAVMVGSRKPMAIPMRSRQSSSSGRDVSAPQEVTNPKWNHRALL
jgi:serine/threonine protein kinase SCH9